MGNIPHVSNGYEKIHLEVLESCAGVGAGKTPPLLMGMRNVLCNIWNDALEFL